MAGKAKQPVYHVVIADWEIDQKIISMYAKGMTARQISGTLMDIYGF